MASVCFRGPKSMWTKKHFGLCTDFNLSDKNLTQQCFFTRHRNKQICGFWETLQEVHPPHTHAGTNNGGSVSFWSRANLQYVDDNEKSAGCPKSVVTLPSKYTFSFTTTTFLQFPSPHRQKLLFAMISLQHQQSLPAQIMNVDGIGPKQSFLLFW